MNFNLDYLRFEDMYTNPLTVLACFFLIIFAVCFEMLNRTLFAGRNSNRSAAGVISFVISLMSVYYIREYVGWLLTFNSLLVLAVIGMFIIFVKPFLRFIRSNF